MRNGGDRFWVLPIVQRHARAELLEEPQMRLVYRWLDWLTKCASEKGGDVARNIDRLPQIELEYPNLLAGLRWCREQHIWNTLLVLAENIWGYAYMVGAWTDAEAILDMVMEAVKATGDEPREGWVELRRGRLATIRGQPQALDHLDRAIAIIERYGVQHELVDALFAKQRILREHGDLVQAEALAARGLAIAEKLGDCYAMARSTEALAAIEAYKGNFDEALEWTKKGEIWAQENRAAQRYPAILYRRGVILIRQGRYEEAEAPLLKALELQSQQKAIHHVALAKYRLAEVYANTNRSRLARLYAQEARDLYERLGMTERQAAAEKLLQDLSRAFTNDQSFDGGKE